MFHRPRFPFPRRSFVDHPPRTSRRSAFTNRPASTMTATLFRKAISMPRRRRNHPRRKTPTIPTTRKWSFALARREPTPHIRASICLCPCCHLPLRRHRSRSTKTRAMTPVRLRRTPKMRMIPWPYSARNRATRPSKAIISSQTGKTNQDRPRPRTSRRGYALYLYVLSSSSRLSYQGRCLSPSPSDFLVTNISCHSSPQKGPNHRPWITIYTSPTGMTVHP